jgi:hypothetical protein
MVSKKQHHKMHLWFRWLFVKRDFKPVLQLSWPVMARFCILCLLAITLLAASVKSIDPNSTLQQETGWSNGRTPAEGPSVPASVCPAGAFITSWTVGDAAPYGTGLEVIVFLQGRCSDGTSLSVVQGDRPAGRMHDQHSNSNLFDDDGYKCIGLRGYYRSRGATTWFVNFMGAGQDLTKSNNTEVFKLNCARVPPANLVVGYSAVVDSFVDAINFITAPPPVKTNASIAAAAASPPSGLNSGALAGVVIAACAFVSCVGGIGFQV